MIFWIWQRQRVWKKVAHLLIHGHLPNRHELAAYKKKLKTLRNLPVNVLAVLEVFACPRPPDGCDAYRRIGIGLHLA